MPFPDCTCPRDEEESHANLKLSYRRFMEEADVARKEDAGKDLIRAVFGEDAIADVY